MLVANTFCIVIVLASIMGQVEFPLYCVRHFKESCDGNVRIPTIDEFALIIIFLFTDFNVRSFPH